MKGKKITKKIAIALLTGLTIFSLPPATCNNIEATSKPIVSFSEKKEEIKKKKLKSEDKYVKGWTTTSVNVRKGPNTETDILETYSFNKEVSYTNYNDKWVKIKYENGTAYMCKDYISDVRNSYKEFDVPSNSGFKSYMPYTAITCVSSDQYILQRDQAYTGNYGIRQVDGRYCVAVGSHFTSEIGTLFDLVLENGTVIPCILADQKADIHTDSQNIVTMHNGCVSEFVVDSQALMYDAKYRGDISYCNEDWNSPVEKVKVYVN